MRRGALERTHFIFGVHGHQPVGNLEEVFEAAYRRAYLPFLEAWADFADIPFALHYSGTLLDWFGACHPEFLDRVAEFVRRGQAELLTGGLYEPILAAIPDADKVGQVLALTGRLERLFGVRPRGMWVAERVWEPHLARPLHEAGVAFAVLDDAHFKAAGLRDADLAGHYLTEEQGAPLALFPISERLRYLIPFRPPEEAIGYLRERHVRDPGGVIVMADDGEKFGGWPGTHETVYREGWLKRFLGQLQDQREWLVPTTFGAALDGCRPRGRIYLPAASYTEMMEWALPTAAAIEYAQAAERVRALPEADRILPFLRGGFWRNFLAKYPEANLAHQRMLRASAKVHAALRAARERADATAMARAEAALHDLWKAQCNDAYWHGVFGGLYLPHLRRAVQAHLIRAEGAADALLHGAGAGWVEVEVTDLDRDGEAEVVVDALALGAVVDPGEGGTLLALDHRPTAIPLLTVIARRPEAYHAKVAERARETRDEGARTIHEERGAKEEGLQGHLHYDWYRRAALIDHFLGPGVTLDAFRRARYEELGDFVGQPYACRHAVEGEGVRIDLARDGHLWPAEGPRPVRVEKGITIPRAAGPIRIAYRLWNRGREPLPVRFGVEFNLALAGSDPPERFCEIGGARPAEPSLRAAVEAPGARRIRLVDTWLGLACGLAWEPSCTLWRFPVETVSQSEAGYERVFQGVALLALWSRELVPEVPATIDITVTLEAPPAAQA